MTGLNTTIIIGGITIDEAIDEVASGVAPELCLIGYALGAWLVLKS